jgi:hypothetical protein
VKTVKIRELRIDKEVTGLTTLNNQLYVGEGYFECDEIKVFDMKADKFTQLSSIKIPRLLFVNDMTSCSRHQCVYISDPDNQVVHRIDNRNEITQWSVNDRPQGLSVNLSHNVLVTCDQVGKMKEFTTDGQLIREIKLQSDIVHPWHTIELTTGQFVVSQGWSSDPLHRVCIVNDAGKVLQSYGGQSGLLKWPVRLAVMNDFIIVADYENSRVLMLSPELSFIRELTSGFNPWRMCIEQQTRRMFITYNRKLNIYSM